MREGIATDAQRAGQTTIVMRHENINHPKPTVDPQLDLFEWAWLKEVEHDGDKAGGRLSPRGGAV